MAKERNVALYIIFFEILIDLGESALDKNYASLWFTWLGWVGVSSLLFVTYNKTGDVVPLIVGFVSIIGLFFMILAMIRKVFDYLLDKYNGKGLAILFVFIYLVVSTFLSIGLMYSIIKSTGITMPNLC